MSTGLTAPLGAIAGDIIGSIYEHQPIKTTEFPLWGVGCRFTDDTVLTVAVADALRVITSVQSRANQHSPAN